MTAAVRPAATQRLPEIVAEALQPRVGWDFRHDATARLLMGEFALTLPRDRELVRQLASIRVQQGDAHVMPFGKHKGKLIEELLVDDPSYLDWLAEQEWFRSEFEGLYAAIVAAEEEP